jgi:hypothetical protein
MPTLTLHTEAIIKSGDLLRVVVTDPAGKRIIESVIRVDEIQGGSQQETVNNFGDWLLAQAGKDFDKQTALTDKELTIEWELVDVPDGDGDTVTVRRRVGDVGVGAIP